MVTGAFVRAVQIEAAAVETNPGEPALIHIWREDREEKKNCLLFAVFFFFIFLNPSTEP